MRFSADMSIYDALQAHPKAREVFVAHGMGCIACMGSTMESISGGAEMHGVDAAAIVGELNALVGSDQEAPAEATEGGEGVPDA